MKKKRNPIKSGANRGIFAALTLIAFAALASGCSSKDATAPTSPSAAAQPKSDSSKLTAGHIALSDAPDVANPAIESIWQNASSLDATTLPINGASGAPSIPVEIKSVYSDNAIYFLVQYDDATEDILNQPLRYNGGYFMNPSSWTIDTNTFDDGFSLMFEISPGSSGSMTFKDNGCTMACHTSGSESWQPGMFPENKGRYDVWFWRASRSNATGLADDDISAGAPTFATTYDQPDDQVVKNNVNCSAAYLPYFTMNGNNGGLDPHYYISAQSMESFGDAYNQQTGNKWQAGDIVPSSFVTQVDPQGQSDFWDVKSRGFWSNGKWTIKFKRALTTLSSSASSPNDVAFIPGNQYLFSFSVHDHSAPAQHYGVATRSFTLALQN